MEEIRKSKKIVLFSATGVGLGHLLSALISTAYYAWKTNRVLALDMREVHFFAKDNHNAFFRNFELAFPKDLEILISVDEVDLIRKDKDLYYLRVSDTLDVSNPFPNRVIMVPCISPGEPFRSNFHRSEVDFKINLLGPLLEAFDKSRSLEQWNSPVIGLHYRATIGELFDRMTKLTVPDYDERYARIMDQYVEKAIELSKTIKETSFLIASDDRNFIKEMKLRLPNSFSLSTRQLDREFAAYVRENNFDISILLDAVVDLWCLSHCDQFIYSRSAFSHFAILNSESLDENNTHYIHMPLFDEILDSVSSNTAIDWARAAVKKVEASRMHYTKSHFSLLRCLQRSGLEESIEAVGIKKVIKWHWEINDDPDVDKFDIFDVRALERNGENVTLLEILRKRIINLPGNPYLLSGYGGSMVDLLTKLGRFDEALKPARKAVELTFEDPHLHHALAVVLTRVGHIVEAEIHYRIAMSFDRTMIVFQTDLADCLSKQGRLNEAKSIIEESLLIDPEYSMSHIRLGEYFLHSSQNSEAETCFEKAIILNGKDPGYFHLLSISRERQGNLLGAIDASKKGAIADPKQSYCLDRVSSLYMNLGDCENSKIFEKRSLEILSRKAALVISNEVTK